MRANHWKNATGAVNARDVPLIVAERRCKSLNKGRKSLRTSNAGGSSIDERIQKLMARLDEIKRGRKFLDESVRDLAHSLGKAIDVSPDELTKKHHRLTKFDCAKTLHSTFYRECFNLNQHPYAMKYLYVMNNACEIIGGDEVKCAAGAIEKHCAEQISPNAVEFKSIV